MKQEQNICVNCGKAYSGRPALSRKDNKSLICPKCGTRKALDSIGITEEQKQETLESIYGGGG